METVATFSAKTIAACGMYCATNDARFYLNGISLEPTDDGCYLVATNGCTLLAIHDVSVDSDFSKKPLIVQFEKSTLSKAKTKAAEYVLLQRDGENWYATVETSKGEMFTASCKMLDARYPDWRRVIPQKTDDSAPPNFNPKYLKQAGEAAMLLSSKKHNDMILFYNGNRTAATWTCSPGHESLEVLGVIMPTANLNMTLPAIRREQGAEQ